MDIHTEQRSESVKRIETADAPAAIGPYSQALVHGDLVFTAGQIPLDPENGEMTDGGVTAQTERVMLNLAGVLAAAGSSLQRVVKTTVFLSDMEDFAAMNEVYGRHFGDHRPARSTVQAARLPRDARVEIEAIAVVDGGSR
jgi:2-iminobutanoate/2-iminopropanoate deaminase